MDAPRNSSIFSLLHLLLLLLNIFSAAGNLERFQQSIHGDGSLRFLVIGDWGRKGDYNQSQVSYQMGRTAEELDVDFLVSTGDNFYDNGLTGEDDPAFEQSFSNIYTHDSLQKQWYSVLGNHDYRGDVLAQLSPTLRRVDRRWLCLRSFVVDAEIVEIFFVDSTPMVDMYFTTPKDHRYDWRGVLPRDAYTSSMLKDLQLALESSNARWKIVVGHHTIRSSSHHGDTQELVENLLPILQAYDVDLYINGHDHCLQHISDDDSTVQFFTSGGGSKAWRGDNNMNQPGLKFFYDGQGFMSVQVTVTEIKIMFYDVFGRVLHTWNRNKELVLSSL